MKVAIIGAGPAGLSAAILLSAQGIETTVYEWGCVGENIACAEGFFDFHNTLQLNLPDSMKIEKLIVADREVFHLKLPKSSKFYTFDRKKWQLNLKERAVKNGAKFSENTKISKSDVSNLSKQNDFVIDASGIKAVSHFIFPKKDVVNYRKGLVPTFQYKLKGDFSEYNGIIKAIVLNNPAGYYWFFPKLSEGKVSEAKVGLGFLSKRYKIPNLKALLNEILQKDSLPEYVIVEKKGSSIPTRRVKKYRQDNIILTGDALGLCSPLHGGGIDSAYLSGEFAARSIINKDFSVYESFLKALDRRFFKEKVIVMLWDYFGSENILKRLKNKGLFEDSDENVVFSNSWLRKALIKLIF